LEELFQRFYHAWSVFQWTPQSLLLFSSLHLWRDERHIDIGQQKKIWECTKQVWQINESTYCTWLECPLLKHYFQWRMLTYNRSPFP
jgi:hypothetical protein